MGSRKSKFILYSVLIVVIILTSIIYRMKFYKPYSDNNQNLPPELRNKTIVRLWMKKSIISPIRSYQIEKFNEENKDNIYIIFTEYKEDYYNALRTTLATKKYAPDIFEYGYTDLMKNDQVASLKDIGFNTKSVDSSNIVTYKNMFLGVKLMETNAKMIWNKEIFKEAGLDPNKPPKTYEELIDYSLKIKEKFPNITPFAFPIGEYEDMKISIGEPSVNEGSIYTSFWDYKKGTYNFNHAKDILNVYKEMYSKNLLAKDFASKSRNQMRSEFYRGDIAMMISTYEDRGYFSNILPLNFEMGIQDIIQTGDNPNVYYYVTNSNFLVANKYAISDKKKREAIKEVYDYMVSEDVNKEVMESRNALPLNVKTTKIENDIYSEYGDVSKFKNETYDPTLFLSRDSAYEIGLIVDAIKGNDSVDDVINKLNDKYKYYYNFAVDKENFNFKYYKK
ncbi:extracellular solute-binding protein [Clostridium sp. cel8]|uniref:ABC transporter substrate-binding protein n=1 Tax=Clostridium sp. cel8 TaxID=2663123 RepID=UPI0015F55663|nr:extracellular solute-binding protein [Clostridium sp. cel8]MBA5850903.1 extracellular solute-binding protein [Clostridium sp. cel8]